MKTTDVVAFLNVSQSAIATYVLKGEKVVNEDNRVKNQILTSSKSECQECPLARRGPPRGRDFHNLGKKKLN